jgi:hypothetical protein
MSERLKVLRSVRTLLSFFTLALLAIEGILLKLAIGLTGTDQIFLATVGAFLLVIVLVTLLALVRPSLLSLQAGSTEPVAPAAAIKYDVFISSPMFSFGDEARYKAHRANVLKLIRVLRDQCGYASYYAGEQRPRYRDFEASDVALGNDLGALRESKFYLLLIPETSATSALVEAGAALILGKPSTYFVHKDAQLPFALHNAMNSGRTDLPRIKKYEYSTVGDLIDTVTVNKQSLFA